MKFFRKNKFHYLSEYPLRLLTSINQTLIIYISFLIIINLFDAKITSYSLSSLFIVTVTVAFLIVMLETNNLWKSKYKDITIIIGVIFCAGLSFIQSPNHNIEALIPFFILTFTVWISTLRKFDSPIQFIYSIKILYLHTPILIIGNLMIQNSDDFYNFSINSWTYLYVFISIFLIFRLKFTNFKSKKKSKIGFDLTLTFIITGIAVLFSLVNYHIVPLLIYIKNWILILIFDFIESLSEHFSEDFYFFMENPQENHKLFSGLDTKGSEAEKTFKLAKLNLHVPSEFWYILLVLILVLVLIYFFKKNNNHLNSINKDDLNEIREFTIGQGNSGKIFSRFAKNVGNKFYNSLDRFSLKFKGSLSDKIRLEYKSFLLYLIENKILDKENTTSQNIREQLNEKFPSISNDINSLTYIYECVRYGPNEPNLNDLNLFKKTKRNILEKIKTI